MKKKTTKPRKKPGVSSRYTPSKNGHVQELYSLGAKNETVFKVLGIGKSTFHNWKNKYPEFSEAIQRGKDNYGCESVEDALLKRALGFTVTEKTVEKDTDGDIIKTVEKERYIAPDPGSVKFFLIARNAKRWGEKKEDDKGKASGALAIANLILEMQVQEEPENEPKVNALEAINKAEDPEVEAMKQLAHTLPD